LNDQALIIHIGTRPLAAAEFFFLKKKTSANDDNLDDLDDATAELLRGPREVVKKRFEFI
jgi:hypothetical protein